MWTDKLKAAGIEYTVSAHTTAKGYIRPWVSFPCGEAKHYGCLVQDVSHNIMALYDILMSLTGKRLARALPSLEEPWIQCLFETVVNYNSDNTYAKVVYAIPEIGQCFRASYALEEQGWVNTEWKDIRGKDVPYPRFKDILCLKHEFVSYSGYNIRLPVIKDELQGIIRIPHDASVNYSTMSHNFCFDLVVKPEVIHFTLFSFLNSKSHPFATAEKYVYTLKDGYIRVSIKDVTDTYPILKNIKSTTDLMPSPYLESLNEFFRKYDVLAGEAVWVSMHKKDHNAVAYIRHEEAWVKADLVWLIKNQHLLSKNIQRDLLALQLAHPATYANYSE